MHLLYKLNHTFKKITDAGYFYPALCNGLLDQASDMDVFKIHLLIVIIEC